MKIKDADSKRFLIAYLFFLFITTIRFFSEAHFSSFVDPQNLIFHHHYWFLFVFFLFLINFKYILRLTPEKTWWVAFASPVILLPILYNILFAGSGKMRLNYISIRNFGEYVKDIFTFMIFSERNQAISGELIIIVAGISIFSFYISRNAVRSIFTGFACYFSLMILGGTILIGPFKPDRVLFFVNSQMKLQNFFSFLYFSAALTAASILFLEHIRTFFKGKWSRVILFSILLVVIFSGLQLFLKSPTVADRIFMISHSVFFAFLITVMIFLRKNWTLKILLILHAFVCSGILYNYWFMEFAGRIGR